jgi:hypothetical protein
MVTQNRFKTGLDTYSSANEENMAEYDANASKYTVTRLLAWFCCPTKYDCLLKAP